MTEWQQVYPDFQAAVARAKVIRSRSFEGHLVDMSANGGDNTRFQAVKLGLINASPDEFKEKVAETTVNITLAALIQESMKHREIVDGTPVADD
jgi:hypothetical protein